MDTRFLDRLKNLGGVLALTSGARREKAFQMRLRDFFLIPNLLSLGRLAFAVPALRRILGDRTSSSDHRAALLLVLSFATDGIDGIVARKFNQQSDLGKVLDPVIDKLVVTSVTLSLVLTPREPRFPRSVLLAMTARDITILTLAGRSIHRYRHLFTSRLLGKATMVVNSVTLLSQLIADWLPKKLVRLLPWVSFSLLVLSSVDYFAVYWRMKRQQPTLDSRP